MKHRLPRQSVEIPLFRYFIMVGGFLLTLLFVAGAYLPNSRVDEGSKAVTKPAILIESSRKWPERIVFDTTVPTTLAVVPTEVPTVASSVRASPLDSMAQLEGPTARKEVGPARAAKGKRVKIARRVSQPRLAYFQQRGFPNYFGSWW